MHVLYLEVRECACSIFGGQRVCMFYIWRSESVHVLYLEVRECACSIFGGQRVCMFYIWRSESVHVVVWRSERVPEVSFLPAIPLVLCHISAGSGLRIHQRGDHPIKVCTCV